MRNRHVLVNGTVKRLEGGHINNVALHLENAFSNPSFYPSWLVHLLSVHCLLFWTSGELDVKAQHITIYVLVIYAQSPKKDHGRWGLILPLTIDVCQSCIADGPTVNVCTTDIVSVKQNMTHESLRVLFIGRQCHIRIPTKLGVDGCQLCRWTFWQYNRKHEIQTNRCNIKKQWK